MLTMSSLNAAPAAGDVLQTEQIKLLAEIAFAATGRKDYARAETIFQSLLVLRPERDFPYLGLGINYLNAGRALDAILILEKGRKMAPDSPDLAVFLALALRNTKRNGEAAKLLAEVLAKHPEDTPILRMAKEMQVS